VYEQLSKLEASNDKMLYLWFEPWAEGLGFPAGSVVELRAVSTVGGELEFETSEGRTAVYGWPGSTLEVSVGGKIVHSFDTAVPVTDMEISTKEAITMLFGSAPEPEPNERRAPTPKAWWRFWD
jgi:hypothetical protein